MTYQNPAAANSMLQRRKSEEHLKLKDSKTILSNKLNKSDSIQQQIAQALNQTSEMIKNTKTISRSLSKKSVFRNDGL